MPRCRKCGALVKDTDRYCWSDGAKLVDLEVYQVIGDTSVKVAMRQQITLAGNGEFRLKNVGVTCLTVSKISGQPDILTVKGDTPCSLMENQEKEFTLCLPGTPDKTTRTNTSTITVATDVPGLGDFCFIATFISPPLPVVQARSRSFNLGGFIGNPIEFKVAFENQGHIGCSYLSHSVIVDPKDVPGNSKTPLDKVEPGLQDAITCKNKLWEEHQDLFLPAGDSKELTFELDTRRHLPAQITFVLKYSFEYQAGETNIDVQAEESSRISLDLRNLPELDFEPRELDFGRVLTGNVLEKHTFVQAKHYKTIYVINNTGKQVKVEKIIPSEGLFLDSFDTILLEKGEKIKLRVCLDAASLSPKVNAAIVNRGTIELQYRVLNEADERFRKRITTVIPVAFEIPNQTDVYADGWIGIDFGTSNSCVAYYIHTGSLQTAPPEECGYFPSDICFTDKRIINSQTVKVGDDAIHYMRDKRRWFRYLRSIKPILSGGLPLKNILTEFLLDPDEGPAMILSPIIEKLLENFVEVKGKVPGKAMFTVPVAASPSLVNTLLKVADDLGLNADIQFDTTLDEPLASVIEYFRYKTTQGAQAKKLQKVQKIMVYDFGGGTFDTAFVEITLSGATPKISVLATGGDHHLGGNTVDETIVEKIFIPLLKREKATKTNQKGEIEEIAITDAIIVDHMRNYRDDFLNYAKKCKERLSERLLKKKPKSAEIEHRVDISGLHADGQALSTVSIVVKESQFNTVIDVLLMKTMNICKEMLKSINVKPQEVNLILNTGQSGKFPQIHKLFKDIFGKNISIAEEAIMMKKSVAKGASYYGFMKHNAVTSGREGLVIEDSRARCLKDYGYWIYGLFGNEYVKLIKKGTKLPAKSKPFVYNLPKKGKEVKLILATTNEREDETIAIVTLSRPEETAIPAKQTEVDMFIQVDKDHRVSAWTMYVGEKIRFNVEMKDL